MLKSILATFVILISLLASGCGNADKEELEYTIRSLSFEDSRLEKLEAMYNQERDKQELLKKAVLRAESYVKRIERAVVNNDKVTAEQLIKGISFNSSSYSDMHELYNNSSIVVNSGGLLFDELSITKYVKSENNTINMRRSRVSLEGRFKKESGHIIKNFTLAGFVFADKVGHIKLKNLNVFGPDNGWTSRNLSLPFDTDLYKHSYSTLDRDYGATSNLYFLNSDYFGVFLFVSSFTDGNGDTIKIIDPDEPDLVKLVTMYGQQAKEHVEKVKKAFSEQQDSIDSLKEKIESTTKDIEILKSKVEKIK